MAQTGIDETLKLESVYLTGPVPRNLGVLTVLGAVFDKVYFPGVHMPKSGYDPREVEKEIVRLEKLNDRSYDTQLLIGAMKLLLHAKTLEGFCEFTADPNDPFQRKDPVPGQLVQAVYESIHGPPRPDFIPTFRAYQRSWRRRGKPDLSRRLPLHCGSNHPFRANRCAAPERHPRLADTGHERRRPGGRRKAAGFHSRGRVHPDRPSVYAVAAARRPDGVPRSQRSLAQGIPEVDAPLRGRP